MTTRIAVFARLRGPGLGDLVQRNILLSLLRRAHPGAEVVLVVGTGLADRFADLLTGHTYATGVLRCPDPDDEDPARWREFGHALRHQRFDLCVVDPDSRGLGAGHAADAGIGERMALPTGGPDDAAITRPLQLPPPVMGRPDLYDYAYAVATAVGLDPVPRPGEVVPELPLTPEHLPELCEVSPRIAVHPGGARHWNRRWPLASYGELCARMTEELGASLYLVGAEDERPELEWLRDRVPHPTAHVVAGASLNRTANLLAGVDLVVGNDSAPAHLAAALRTPTVVIYGPTGTEFLWARVYPHHRGVSLRYRCQGMVHAAEDVGSRRCAFECPVTYVSAEGPYPRCLADLSTDAVWRAVISQLPAHRPSRSPR